VRYLLDALDALRRQDFPSAEKLVGTAKNLAPDYFEVHRVDALVKAKEGNVSGAQASYEAAVDLEPNSAPLKFWYGGFLMRYLDDVERALKYFSEAAEIGPNTPEVQIELARATLYLRNFDEADSQIEALLARTDLSIWEKRQAWDLRLQFHQRHADYLLHQQHDELGAREALEQLRGKYEAIPHDVLDSKMRERLKKAIPTAQDCSKIARDTSASNALRDLASWFSKESGLTYDEMVALNLVKRLEGHIARFWREAGFGFISCNDGRELYFNLKGVRWFKDMPEICEGQRVTFDLGRNKEGVCAVDVRLTETDMP
jgi:LuxR family transcriptional regulator, glucitol operon activator